MKIRIEYIDFAKGLFSVLGGNYFALHSFFFCGFCCYKIAFFLVIV